MKLEMKGPNEVTDKKAKNKNVEEELWRPKGKKQMDLRKYGES